MRAARCARRKIRNLIFNHLIAGVTTVCYLTRRISLPNYNTFFAASSSILAARCNSSSAGTTPASTFFLSRDFINSACFNEACRRASEDERTCARRIASDAETRRVAFVAFLTPLRAGILFVTKKNGKSPSARHIQQVLGSKNESARAKD